MAVRGSRFRVLFVCLPVGALMCGEKLLQLVSELERNASTNPLGTGKTSSSNVLTRCLQSLLIAENELCPATDRPIPRSQDSALPKGLYNVVGVSLSLAAFYSQTLICGPSVVLALSSASSHR